MASFASYTASPSFSSHRSLAFRIPQIPSSHSLSSGHLSFQGMTCIRVGNSPSRRPTKVYSVLESKAADISGKSWDKLVLNSETPVLVEFYAPWCGPCKMVHRVIDELATEYGGRLQCFTLQADKHPEIAEKYDIKAVPIVLLFKNGQRCDSVVGTMPKEFYVTAIEKVLAS